MNKFFFLDLETTGLDPTKNVILEVAAIVTDNKLNILDEYSAAVWAPPSELQKMDDWCRSTHTNSGLLKDVMENGVSLNEAEHALQQLKRKHFPVTKGSLAGSSVHFDKRFVEVHMPSFNKELNHRIVDVSSFMIALGNYWGITQENRNITAHRALADIKDSIRFLKGYLERFNG